ncbi:MAG TPA: alpha/beta fold hydrolase [Actinomycetota bacterium]|nr:alpha/beta fold hydrolase [Actinomycetota bacterium]
MSDFVAGLHPLVIAGAIVAAYFAAALWALGANLVLATRKTDARLVRAGLLRRWWRRYRSIWLRSGLTLAGWPHVVDVLLRTKRVSVATTPAEVVWEEGRAALYRYRSTVRHAEPVLVVHAVVSKPWILDLTPERSFVAALANAGFDVFLLDWGDPAPEDAARGLTAYANTLLRAERIVLTITGRERVHLVGYCFGGTLCLARAAARDHARVGSIALLAAPVDFSVPAGLNPLMTHPLFKPVYVLDEHGLVPAAAVRESFHALRPQAMRTALTAWRRRRDPSFRKTYDPLARWVWEHRELPGQMFFDLVDLFRTNGLAAGTLELAGEIARLDDVRAPVLALIPEHDHITPSGSSHALTTHRGLDVTVVNAAAGHVSMIAGSAARETTWPRITEWLERNQGASGSS